MFEFNFCLIKIGFGGFGYLEIVALAEFWGFELGFRCVLCCKTGCCSLVLVKFVIWVGFLGFASFIVLVLVELAGWV